MVHKRAWGTTFAALAVLICVSFSACASSSLGGAAVLPEWQFRWLPVGSGTAASEAPQAAFANAGRAQHVQPGSVTEHSPAAVVWLASGRTFAEAVVQLDPAGRYWNLVTLLIDPNSQVWQALAGDLPQPTPCGSGSPFSGQFAAFGAYCTLEPVRSGTIPAISSTLWTTPQSETFIAGRFGATAQRPTSDVAALTLAGDPGWLVQDKGWTVIVVLLPDGDSVIFASTADAQRCQELAADFLRLGADPLSIR